MMTPQASSCSLKPIVPMESFVPVRYMRASAYSPLASFARAITSSRKISMSFMAIYLKNAQKCCLYTFQNKRKKRTMTGRKVLSHIEYERVMCAPYRCHYYSEFESQAHTIIKHHAVLSWTNLRLVKSLSGCRTAINAICDYIMEVDACGFLQNISRFHQIRFEKPDIVLLKVYLSMLKLKNRFFSKKSCMFRTSVLFSVVYANDNSAKVSR